MNTLHVGDAIALSCTKHNLRASTPDRVTRRHPILPALPFVQAGREIPITEQDLSSMATLLKSGDLGERRMVTMAHPDKTCEAPAVGWMLTKTAALAPYKSTTALYCEVEWLAEMATKIQAGEYGYLSPVFTMSYTDQTGNERGPALLFAGVTNDPHWTDQPDLLEAFNAHYAAELNVSANAAQDASAQNAEPTKEAEMPQPVPQDVVKLTADLAARDAQIAEFSAKLAAQGKQVEELTANHNTVKAELESAQKQLADANAREAKTRGDALVARFTSTGQLLPKHLETADKKPTALSAMAYTEPEKFEAIVSTFDKPAVPPSQPVGNGSLEGITEQAAERRMLQLAREHCAKYPGVEFLDAIVAVKAAQIKE